MADPEPESETAVLEHLEWIEFQSIGIYVTSFLVLVGIVGAVGNIHVLLVYCKWMRHTTYRVFVMTLSLTDLLGSTLSIAFVILELRHPLLFTSSELCKVSRMVIYFIATFSLCLLDIISLERLWLICRPLGYRTGTTAAIFICLVCAAFTFCLVSIPAALIYGSDQRPSSFPTLVGCECTVTGYLRRPILGVIYQTALVVLFTFLLFICITTYGYIYWKLKRVMLNDSTLRVHSLHHYNRHYHGGDRATANTKRSNRSESIVDLTIVSETSETSEHSDISIPPTECAKEIYDRTTLDEKYLEIRPDLEAEKESDTSFHNVKNSKHNATLCSRDIPKESDKKGLVMPVSTLRVHVRNHQTLKKGVYTTRMFLVISIVSFFTSLPYFVLAALRNLNWDVYFALDENFGPLDEFLTSLMFLNHAVNPVIYGLMDKKFRKGCVQMYRQLFHLFKQSSW